MKQLSKSIMCLSLLCHLSIAQVNAEDTSAPYVLTQSINNIPLEKARCIELLRNYMKSNEGDSDKVQQLTATIAKLNQDIETTTEQFNEVNERIAPIEQSRKQATEQHLLAVEAAYENYRNQDSQFDNMSEEEQLALLTSNEHVQEWQQALDELEQQLNAVVAQRDQLEKQHQELLYELDAHTSQLERYKQEHSQLNQCLLYPYSTQREELGQLLINTQVTDLKELLVNLDVYLQRMVPIAYRKVAFSEIATLFHATRSAEEIETQLYGKPVIKLDDNGREYYTYARELNSWDIEILANLALRDYFATGNEDELYARYNEVLSIKEGQFAYFYTINQEAFEQMKHLLAEYLNAHQLWDTHTVAQLKAFHERYQMKLVLFDESSQQWHVAPTQESGYYQTYATQNLVQQAIVASPEPEAEHSNSRSNEVEHVEKPSRLDTLKEKFKRSSQKNIEQVKSLPKAKRDKSTDESVSSSSSTHVKPRLKADSPESSHKSSDKPKKSIHADLPNAESASEKSKAKAGNKEEINLPSTGERTFILWIAIAMLTVGIAVLSWDVYLRYKKRKALEKIKLD